MSRQENLIDAQFGHFFPESSIQSRIPDQGARGPLRGLIGRKLIAVNTVAGVTVAVIAPTKITTTIATACIPVKMLPC